MASTYLRNNRLSKTGLLIGLLLFVLIPLTLSCAGKKKVNYRPTLPGQYEVVGKYQPTVNNRPEIIEVFSFESKPCYRYSKDVGELYRRYQKRVRIKYVPIFWGDQSPLPAKFYYIALKAEETEKLKAALFEAKFEKGLDIADVNVLARIAKQLGLADEFSALIFSNEINEQALEGNKLIEQYGLTATPSVIVNRSLLVNPTIAGGTVQDMQSSVAEMLKGLIGW